MPKKKTKQAAAKRLKVTKHGKIKFRHAGVGHLLTNKSAKRRRHLRSRGVLSGSEQRRMRDLFAPGAGRG